MNRFLTALALTLALGSPVAVTTVDLHAASQKKSTSTKKAKGKSKSTPHVTEKDPKAPKGAHARCKDGTYSTANGSGACSHHGGVAAWVEAAQ
jgi:hypothetical protein